MNQSKTATRPELPRQPTVGAARAAALAARAAAGIDASTPTWAVTIIQRLGKMERALEELKRQAKINSGLEQKGCDLVVQQLEAIRDLLGPRQAVTFDLPDEDSFEPPNHAPFGLAPIADGPGFAQAVANVRTNWDALGDPLRHDSHCNYFCTYDGPCTCDKPEPTLISKAIVDAHDARVRAWLAPEKPYPRFMWAIRAWRRWTGK